MEKGIIVDRLVKRFGKVTAIDKLSFTSRKGINLILGPNGAGKSTLLRSIAGLYRPDTGRVTVLGSDPYENAELRYKISFLADNYGLYDFLTVRQNLDFFGKFYGLRKGEAVGKIRELFTSLELSQYIDSKVEELSRGTKQKVAFCRTMLNDAEVYLLDEPTAFLDVKTTRIVRMQLEDLAKHDKTVVFVTQRIDEVTRFNSRISVIRKGRLIADTDTNGLYNSVLRGAHVTIRFAKPISEKIAGSIRNIISTNSREPTLITVKVKGYKQINETVAELMDKGAYVVGIDYLEPAIDELLFGENVGTR